MKEVDEKVPVKLFSVEEANSLIPQLRPLIRSAVDSHTALSKLQSEIQRARDHAIYDGGSPYGSNYIFLLKNFTDAISKIEEMGVLVKDLRIGLCDFPHWKDGHVIYLCWKMDEERVSYWHEVDAGFSGRQPI
ncbi:MAG: DUF2203 domain-containing protein [Acidobacteriota bacterium]